MEKTFKEKLASAIYDFLEQELEEQTRIKSIEETLELKELDDGLNRISSTEDLDDKLMIAKSYIEKVEALRKTIQEKTDEIEINQNSELCDVFVRIMKNSSDSCSYIKAVYDISLHNITVKE